MADYLASEVLDSVDEETRSFLLRTSVFDRFSAGACEAVLGMPVDRNYADRSPFVFTGTVKKVVFDINPHPSDEHEHELHEHTHQTLAGHAINA